MNAYLEHLQKQSNTTAYTTFGWHGRSFMLGDILFTEHAAPERQVYYSTPRLQGVGSSSGTLKEWTEEVSALCSDPSWWQLIPLSLAAPLMHLVEANQCAFVTIPQSSGLTTAGKVIASVYGDPRAMVQVTEQRGVQTRLGTFRHLPVVVEDLSIGAMTAATAVERSWNTVTLSIIPDRTIARNTMVVTLNAPKSILYNPLRTYGVLGPEFIQYIVTNQDRIRTDLQEELKDIDIANKNTAALRACMKYATNIFSEITGIDMQHTMDIIERHCPVSSTSDPVELFISINRSKCATITDTGVTMPTDRACLHRLSGRIDYRPAFKVLIAEVSVWRKFCVSIGADPANLLSKLEADNRVVEARKRLDLHKDTPLPPLMTGCIVLLLP
jgi:hypothetical protein